ncbi:hypothetical protein JOM56_003097 [Amanita muscaria]
MSTTKHWSWAYFITDNQFFRKNNSFKNAWCTACLNHHKDQLRQLDIVNAAVSGISSGRTDTNWEAQGGYRTSVFFTSERTVTKFM